MSEQDPSTKPGAEPKQADANSATTDEKFRDPFSDWTTEQPAPEAEESTDIIAQSFRDKIKNYNPGIIESRDPKKLPALQQLIDEGLLIAYSVPGVYVNKRKLDQQIEDVRARAQKMKPDMIMGRSPYPGAIETLVFKQLVKEGLLEQDPQSPRNFRRVAQTKSTQSEVLPKPPSAQESEPAPDTEHPTEAEREQREFDRFKARIAEAAKEFTGYRFNITSENRALTQKVIARLVQEGILISRGSETDFTIAAAAPPDLNPPEPAPEATPPLTPETKEPPVDEQLNQAIQVVLRTKNSSISHLQRQLKLGYFTASNLIKRMEAMGILGASDAKKPREILLETWPPTGAATIETTSTTKEQPQTPEEVLDAIELPDEPEEPLDAINLDEEPLDAEELPDEPETATPETERFPETQEDKTDLPQIAQFKSIAERFRSTADAFIRKYIKGEVEPEPVPLNKTEVAKTVAIKLIGAACSLGGIKAAVDFPIWLLQKLKFTKDERNRIKQAIDSASPIRERATLVLDSGETSLGWEIVEDFGDGTVRIAKNMPDGKREGKIVKEYELEREHPLNPVEQKKRRLEKAVMESKYLTSEKKQELLQKLQDTVESYATTLDDYKEEHDNKIVRFLDQAIETRVKGVTALKETLNSAMTALGLKAARSLAYGAVALYERGVKVKKEIESGERTEGFAKELIVNGFKETWKKFSLQEGETKLQKAMNFAQSLGTVTRFVGFSSIALSELIGEGRIQDAIDQTLTATEQKGIVQTATDNFQSNFDHYANKLTFGLVGTETTPSSTGSETEQKVDTHKAPQIPPPPKEQAFEPTTGEETPSVLEVATDKTTDQQPGDIVEFEPMDVIEESELQGEALKAATVASGDGVLRIFQRQLTLNPEKFGFTGDTSDKKAVTSWVRKNALSIAKQSGLMNQNGWLGIRGKAIGKMAIGLELGADGKPEVNFIDVQTGEKTSMEAMREKRFIYDYSKPTEPPTELPSDETETQTTEELPDTSPETQLVDTDDVSTGELENTETFTGELPDLDADAKIYDASESSTNDHVIAETEHSDSGTGTPSSESTPSEPTEPIPEAVSDATEATPQPIRELSTPQGKVMFTYDGDKVTGMRMDTEPTSEELDRAAARFGTSETELVKANIRKLPDDNAYWKANAPTQNLMERMNRETRIENTIKEMEKQGLQETSEYKVLKRQAGVLKGTIKRAFNQLGLEHKIMDVEKATRDVTEEIPTDKDVDQVTVRPSEPVEMRRQPVKEIETQTSESEPQLKPIEE